MRRLVRAVLATIAFASVAFGAAAPSPAAADTYTDDAAQQLAERYAPVVRVREQPEACDTDGEAFAPMSVDAVLGNPQIALRQLGSGDPVVTWAPDGADLYGLGQGFYLDFPGSALEPGCLYEQDFHRYTAELANTVYAHVVTQDDRPGQIVVEYWFYWYFNRWNNTHESDWEGIQVVFPASTPEEALLVAPSSVGYAQHEGGERATWGSSKLELVGDRPVVYSSAGSHASYFEAGVHLGRGASEGFGCDNTDGPSTTLQTSVVVLPAAATSANDEFAWLGFEGHWGERHAGPYNGPTGPTAKGRWERPIDWQDDLRSSSVEVPTPGSRSGDIVEGFCEVVEFGSNQLMSFTRSPTRAAITLAILVAVVLFLVRRTAWTATEPTPLIAVRRLGQMLRTSASMFARAPGAFIRIGAVAVPVAIAAAALSAIMQHVPVLGGLLSVTSSGGSARVALSLLSGALASAAAFVFVSAAVVQVMADVSEGLPPSASRAIHAVHARWRHLTGGFALAAAIVLVLFSTVLLAPVAIFFLVRYQLLSQVVMLEEPASGGEALSRSSAYVRHHWWHTAVTIGLIGALTKVISALVGLLLLVVVQPPFWALSTFVAAADALLAPFAAIAAAYVYGNAVARKRIAAEASAPEPMPAEV